MKRKGPWFLSARKNLKKTESKDEEADVVTVDCPICSKSFLPSIVEIHARDCQGDGQGAVSGSAENPKELLECKKCFKMFFPTMYERHVESCGSGSRSDNAMNVLMKGAMAKPRNEYFACLDGFQCRWFLNHRQETCKWTSDKPLKMFKNILHDNKSMAKGTQLHVQSMVQGLEQVHEQMYYKIISEAAMQFPFLREFVERFWSVGKKATFLTVGQLKSMLQKAIRRNGNTGALFCAVELLMRNRDELFRRIPIIVLEDVLLHPEYDFLVWVMCASTKGFIPTVAHLKKYLRIVNEVGLVGKRDVFQWGEKIEPGLCTLNELLSRCENLATEKQKTLIMSILCRAEYGGMQGDTLALRIHAQVWLNRFEKENVAVIMDRLVKTFSRDKKNTSNEVTVFLAGIDFHVYPAMKAELTAKFSNSIDENDILKAIWYFYSSINNRDLATFLPEEDSLVEAANAKIQTKRNTLQSVWSAVEPHVVSISRSVLEKQLLGNVLIL